MIEIAGYVRQGANAYLRQQYIVVAGFFVVIVILLSFAAFGLGVQSKFVPFAFLTGGFFSGLAGWIGMRTATMASNRTTEGARKSLNQGLQVAFRSGAVMGLTVVGLGLLDITLVVRLPVLDLAAVWPRRSVAGRNHGHHALLRHGCQQPGAVCSRRRRYLHQGGRRRCRPGRQGRAGHSGRRSAQPGHDRRQRGRQRGRRGRHGCRPVRIVLRFDSGHRRLGVAAFASPGSVRKALVWTRTSAQLQALFLPMAIAGVGIFLSIAGIYLVRTEEGATQKNLLKALARGINASCGLIVIAAVRARLVADAASRRHADLGHRFRAWRSA